jgi:hypothetical protein
MAKGKGRGSGDQLVKVRDDLVKLRQHAGVDFPKMVASEAMLGLRVVHNEAGPDASVHDLAFAALGVLECALGASSKIVPKTRALLSLSLNVPEFDSKLEVRRSAIQNTLNLRGEDLRVTEERAYLTLSQYLVDLVHSPCSAMADKRIGIKSVEITLKSVEQLVATAYTMLSLTFDQDEATEHLIDVVKAFPRAGALFNSDPKWVNSQNLSRMNHLVRQTAAHLRRTGELNDLGRFSPRPDVSGLFRIISSAQGGNGTSRARRQKAREALLPEQRSGISAAVDLIIGRALSIEARDEWEKVLFHGRSSDIETRVPVDNA